MKERAAELKAEKGKGAGRTAKEAQACLDAIEALTGTDREIAERVHAVVAQEAPDLAAKTWYGMPAYARDGKVVLFVQPASKFEARYLTLGFNDDARRETVITPLVTSLTAHEPAARARKRSRMRRLGRLLRTSCRRG